MNRSKNIGTAAETKVVRAIRDLGFGTAERAALAGNLDRGDITGTPGICWEVKGGDAARYASDGQIAKWLIETETERQNCAAEVGVLVIARWKKPPERWWAIFDSYVFACLALPFSRDQLGPIKDTVVDRTPVRVNLTDATRYLRGYGFGDPL